MSRPALLAPALLLALPLVASAGPYDPRPDGGRVPGSAGAPTHSPPRPEGRRNAPGLPGHRPPRPVALDPAIRLRAAEHRMRELDRRIEERNRRIHSLYDDREYLEQVPEARFRYLVEELDRDMPLDEVDAYIADIIGDLEDEVVDLNAERDVAAEELRDARGAVAARDAVRAVEDAVRETGRAVRAASEEAARNQPDPEQVDTLPRDPETGRPIVNLPLGE